MLQLMVGSKTKEIIQNTYLTIACNMFKHIEVNQQMANHVDVLG